MKVKFCFILIFLIASNNGAVSQVVTKRVVPHYSINYEIHFWTNQFKEHAEFTTDFTADEDLKEEGNKLIAEWKNFQRALPKNQNKKESFLNLAKKNKSFQDKVKNALDPEHELYKLAPDLIAHMNLETDYVVKKVQGKKMTKADEVKFWAQEHEQEAAAMSALINPGELPLKNRAKTIENDLKQEKNVETVIHANEALDELGQRLNQDPRKSRIPAKLAAHEKRERQRAIEVLQNF